MTIHHAAYTLSRGRPTARYDTSPSDNHTFPRQGSLYLLLPLFPSSRALGSLGVVSDDFDLDSHVVVSKSRHANTRPNGLMVRHPLLKVSNHGRQRFVVDGHVVGVYSVHLRPAFAPHVLQVELDILKGPIDLRVDLLVLLVIPSLGVPSAYRAFSAGFQDMLESTRVEVPLTLSGAFDPVAHSHGLAVADFDLLVDSSSFVGVVLEMGHDVYGRILGVEGGLAR